MNFLKNGDREKMVDNVRSATRRAVAVRGVNDPRCCAVLACDAVERVGGKPGISQRTYHTHAITRRNPPYFLQMA